MTISFKPALLGVAAATAMVTGSLQAQAETLTLRFSQWIPAAHFSQKNGLHVLFKEMEKVTEGRVKVVISAKALGPPPRQMQIAVDGVTDLAWGVHGYQPGVYPLGRNGDAAVS